MTRRRVYQVLKTCGLSAFLLALAAPTTAQLIEVKNDSVIDFGSVAIQAGFVAGEQGAAWLTPNCEADLVAVRILWLDFVSSGTDSLGEAITISMAGTFPAPGTPLLELVGPVLTEGVFNEYIVNPPIPVASGDTVVVDFKFFQTPPPLGPSLVTDIDGCQADKNSIFAIPPSSWLDLCLLGVSGDLAIRAVVACSDEEEIIFEDGFESGDTSAWSTAIPFGSSQPTPSIAAPGYPILKVDPTTFAWRILDGRD